MPGQKAASEERRAQIIGAALQVAIARGVEELTVRRVADAAGLSHGLVHFHFRTKPDLLGALLDVVLRRTAAAEAVPGELPAESPVAQLLAVMHSEIARLAADHDMAKLFFDFSVMGAHNHVIRRRMSAELVRYRRAFRPLVTRAIESEPARFAGVTPDDLAAVVVSFIKGSALQAVIDPRGFDTAGFLTASAALLGQMEAGVTRG
jgi:TetR/AcrR family transcriptional repressor of bet genes